MKNAHQFAAQLGFEFNDENLLLQALIHRSYLNEHPNLSLGHNERLEFLGDAILEVVVTEYLYRHYDNPEGELTNWRAALVNAKMLADIAHHLGVEEYLHLSRGEAKDKNQKARNYILANAMEAIIGALYLDQGLKKAQTFIEKNIIVHLPEILAKKLYIDPKSRFQEEAQDRAGITPSYQVLSESGPDHNKNFVIGVFLEEELVAQGTGTSKQEAQMAAAEEALKAKDW